MKATAVWRYVGGYLAAAAIGVLAGSLLAFHHSTGSGPAAADGGGAGTVTSGQQPLQVRGSVVGLTPGTPATVDIHVTNPNPGQITIRKVTVSAGDASPTCRADNLSVGSYDSDENGQPRYQVPGGGSAVVSLPVELTGSSTRNQDSCRSVTFPLSYTVTGTAWTR